MVEFLVVFNDFFFLPLRHNAVTNFNKVFDFDWTICQLSPECYFYWLPMLLQRDGPDLGLFLPNCDIFDRFILKNEINNKLPEITQIRFKIYV